VQRREGSSDLPTFRPSGLHFGLSAFQPSSLEFQPSSLPALSFSIPRQLLWLPTTREEKYKAKQAIDTFFVRGGDVLSAVRSTPAPACCSCPSRSCRRQHHADGDLAGAGAAHRASVVARRRPQPRRLAAADAILAVAAPASAQ
jgi:hypothetical protein